MNQVSVKLLKMALEIVIHRDEDYKIKAATLRMSPGYPKLSYINWKYFSQDAKDYILKQYPFVLSSLEIELL